MNITKATRREKKREKRNRMQVDGRGVFLTQEILINKGEDSKKKKKKKSKKKRK